MDLSLANLIDVGIEDDFHSSDVYIVDSFSLFIINFAGTSFFLEYAPYCTSFYYTSQIFCLNISIMHSIYQKGQQFGNWRNGVDFSSKLIYAKIRERIFKTILYLSKKHQGMVSITERKLCSILGVNVFMGYIACHY